MQPFTDAVRTATAAGNHYAALALALTLPDVCGGIAEPEKKSQPRYLAWIGKYLPPDYWRFDMPMPFLPEAKKSPLVSPETFYALRCAYLHAGKDDITEQRIRQALDEVKFVVPAKGITVHRNVMGIQATGKLVMLLDVTEFCSEICAGVEAWSREISTDAAALARLALLVKIYTPDKLTPWGVRVT
jgi:hypothetical protein